MKSRIAYALGVTILVVLVLLYVVAAGLIGSLPSIDFQPLSNWLVSLLQPQNFLLLLLVIVTLFIGYSGFFGRPNIEVTLLPSFRKAPVTAGPFPDFDIELLQVKARKHDILHLKAQGWINGAGPTELVFIYGRYQRPDFDAQPVNETPLAKDEQKSLNLRLREGDLNRDLPGLTVTAGGGSYAGYVDIDVRFLSLGQRIRGKTLYKLRLNVRPNAPSSLQLLLTEKS